MLTSSPLLPADILEPLEHLMFGAVGITTLALSASSAGELTMSQWRALVVIGRGDGVRVGEIAGAVGVSLPSASRLVRRLEHRGLVYTQRDEADRRATLVRLSPKGGDLREHVVARRRALMNAALSTHARKLPSNLAAGLTAIARAFDSFA